MNEILLEYYQGRPKELLNCEGYLREIIKLIKKDHEDTFRLSRGRAFYRDAEPCKKLNKELAKFFNIKEMNIYWDSGTLNAYTWSGFSFLKYDRKNNYLAGKYTDATFHICVYEDIVYQAGLNEQELMAILLHEIGHNFYFCPITAGFELFYGVLINPFSIIYKWAVTFVDAKVKPAVIDFLKKELPFIVNIQDAWSDIVTNVTQFLYPLDTLGTVAGLATGFLQLITTNPIQGITNYGNEKAADSMCAKYGYGPEQTSALRKLENPENNAGRKLRDKGGAVTSIMVDISRLCSDIIMMMALDPHPSHSQRAQSMLRKLKRDLAGNEYPPKAKRDLEAEIKRMEKACDIATQNSTESKVQVRNTWYKFMNKITAGHTDFREIFSPYFDNLAF